MPLVNVMVNNRAYTLACDEGEEDHLKGLAAQVDTKVREAQNIVGQTAGDTKLMLTAALLMADEQHDTAKRPAPPVAGDDEAAAAALEKLASRLEEIEAKLARA